ncbi:MAG TPA: saccharopine dehydrogenase NADP-binding domain-containing protein [Kribbellaceae bacterium]|nr:saccharopine dehydrogenase NADP-binding domain-containing protein [Kribbellaceae bacterium]
MTYDVVLFGATGFTGALTAAYLAEHAPPSLRWAVAGRNKAKLEALRARLGREVDLLHADASEPAALADIASSTRLVVSTVGPYVTYGDPLVRACAEAGTDYADLTGEPEFVNTTYVRYHDRAVASGARLVHACGFESIPYDLGVQYTVEQLPDDVPLRIAGLVRAGGTLSGGTIHSALTAFSRGRQNLQAARDRRRAEPRPRDRSARAGTDRIRRLEGFWAVPLPTIDPQIVARSARALPSYGPDFVYTHYMAVKRLPVAVGGVAGVGALVAAAQVPPLRNALLRRLEPGDGPSPSRRETSWFTVRFVGTGGGRRVVTEVSGGDPGYGETAKMLGESALCLALDDLPQVAGQTTTAVAMGNKLRDRLVAAGIGFRVLSDEAY